MLVQFIDLAARLYKTVTAQSVTLAATSLTHCVSAGGEKNTSAIWSHTHWYSTCGNLCALEVDGGVCLHVCLKAAVCFLISFHENSSMKSWIK